MIQKSHIEQLRDMTYPYDEYHIREDIDKRKIYIKDWIPSNIKDENGYINNDIIDAFNPDNININKYWAECMTHFPLLSINGNPEVTSADKANEHSLKLAGYTKIINYVDSFFEKSKKNDLTALEIGPGYGGFYLYLAHKYGKFPIYENYYALDVVKCVDLPIKDRLFIGNGREFPNEIMKNKYDLIYSSNVFQHLSLKQKEVYFKNAYDCLKRKGIFCFSDFILPAPDKKIEGNSYMDSEGNQYSQFFLQFIRIYEYSVYEELFKKIGFKIIEKNMFSRIHTTMLKK